VAIVVIIVVLACRRGQACRPDDSRWRDPRRYSIDTSLDEA
jgi:hypothetical protein